MHRAAALVAASALVVVPACGGGSSSKSTKTVGLVAVGHFGLTGENTDPNTPHGIYKANSWATGDNPDVKSIYERMIAILPATKGNVANTAHSEAVARDLVGQVDAALDSVPHPALVIVQIIDSDIKCDGTDESRIPQFGKDLQAALTDVSTKSPASHILVVGHTGHPSVDFTNTLVQQVPGEKSALMVDDECAPFDSHGNLQELRFARLQQIIDLYQAEQARVCSLTPNCSTDDGALGAYVDDVANFTDDYSNLNVKGLAQEAALVWPKVQAILTAKAGS